jgi:DUF1680 family protein
MTRRELLRAGAASVPASLLSLAVGQTGDAWRSAGILDVRNSPHAKVQNVPIRAVRMAEGFWTPRRQVNVEKSIPTMLELLEEHGAVDNFRRLSGRKNVPRRGPLYTDSDVYKWMEAVAFVLQNGDEPKLRAHFDRLTDEILAAQEPSGYLNTYWSGELASKRFTEMERGHELYCLGHLLQAAIAYQRATGGARLLDGGIKFVNYLVENFGPDKRPLLTGHPELEMALVELYRTTGDKRYLNLAGYLLHGDGERLKLTPRQLTYMFSGKPFTSRTFLEGHAVRAMYACCGATDYYLETGDAQYWKTIETLWRDMVRHKMYITGGVGSRAAGEAFGQAYELPNLLAYTESCAAIGNMMWNWRLFTATGDAKYVDVIERALYNGINSGMSLEGTMYCYRNPLELTGDPLDKIRNPWYDTTCCPPNLERILASLPGYIYGVSKEGVYVNLYHPSTLDWRIPDGPAVKLSQSTKYPWDGAVDLTPEPESPSEFTLFVRIPAWSGSSKILVNGQSVDAKPGEYAAIRRTWKRGDKVRLEFSMEPHFVAANPRVSDDVGKVAVQRGPLVYCLEGLDQNISSLADVSIIASPEKLQVTPYKPDALGGIVEIKAPGVVSSRPSAEAPLYFPFTPDAVASGQPVELTFIPYYTFQNRGTTAMQVWTPYLKPARG